MWIITSFFKYRHTSCHRMCRCFFRGAGVSREDRCAVIEIEDASEFACGVIWYISHARAAKFSLYLHYSRACAVRGRCIYSRGAFAGIQATWRPGLISEVSRDLGIFMRALFPSALFRDFAGERSRYGRTEDPYLAPGEEEFLSVRQKSRRPSASDTIATR